MFRAAAALYRSAGRDDGMTGASHAVGHVARFGGILGFLALPLLQQCRTTEGKQRLGSGAPLAGQAGAAPSCAASPCCCPVAPVVHALKFPCSSGRSVPESGAWAASCKECHTQPMDLAAWQWHTAYCYNSLLPATGGWTALALCCCRCSGSGQAHPSWVGGSLLLAVHLEG